MLRIFFVQILENDNKKSRCIATAFSGIYDNIFELGTSSLTLALIHERIEELYPGQLEVTDLFDYPTIAEMSAFLEKKL